MPPSDQSNVNLALLTDLTIQGGWNGKVKGYKVKGVSTFSVPLTVINWNGNVTINNVNISGTSGNGLNVLTKGNIHVHDVQSNNNNVAGAYLDNTSGTGTTVIVDNSIFNGRLLLTLVCLLTPTVPSRSLR